MTANDLTEPLLQSIAKAEAHIRIEYGTRMVGVMDTVGKHPHFAMMLQPGQVAVLSGRDDIDSMYKGSVALAAPQASRLLSQRASDWYMFIENVPTRLWMANGEFKTVQTVTLFVTDDENGITGEYAWQRHYPQIPGINVDGETLPERSLNNLQLHESLLDAVCRGDTAALASTLEPDCIWAQRDYRNTVEGGEIVNLQSATTAADFVEQSHAVLNPLQVSVLNRQVTDWYVFAEELWVVEPADGECRQYRTAVVYAVSEAGKFEAVLGFGTALEAPSPSASRKVGLAFWPEGVGPDVSSRQGYPEV